MLRVSRAGRGAWKCRKHTHTVNNRRFLASIIPPRMADETPSSWPITGTMNAMHLHTDCRRIARRQRIFFEHAQNQRCYSATAPFDSSSSSSSSSSSLLQENNDAQQQQQYEEQSHPSRQEIVNFAHDVLFHTSPQQCPLGSMTAEQWEDSVTALVYCLRLVHDEHHISAENKSLLHTADDDDGALHDIERTDHILNRLIQEHATQSKASRPWTTSLEDWKVAMLQTWLAQTTTFPAAANNKSDVVQHLACKRAEHLFRKIKSHRGDGFAKKRQQGVVDDGDASNQQQQHIPLHNEFVSLVQAWLRLNTLVGVDRALELLLWDGIPDLFHNQQQQSSRQALIACYHEALQQSVQLSVFGNSSSSSSSSSDEMNYSTSWRQELRQKRQRLVEWMEMLADNVPGWQEVKSSHDLVLRDETSTSTTTSSTPRLPHDKNENSNTAVGDDDDYLQSFEAQVLVQKFVKKVESAGPNDAEIIHQVVDHWKSLSSLLSSSSATQSQQHVSHLAGALVDYYIRIQDPESATLWLSRIQNNDDDDNGDNNNNDDDDDNHSSGGIWLEKRTSAIIALWAHKAATSHIPEAPWRAQELLTRLEEIISKRRRRRQEHQQNTKSNTTSSATGEITDVDHRLYMAVANLWCNSNEPRGAQKAIQICLDRPTSFHPQLLNLAINVLARAAAAEQGHSSLTTTTTTSSWEQASTRKALKLFETHYNELDDEAALVSMAQGLEQALVRSKPQSRELLGVARIVLDHGVMPSGKTCELLFSTLKKPNQVLEMVERLQNAVDRPRINLYAQAVNCLFGMQKKNRSAQLRHIVVDMLLDRIAHGIIPLENQDDDDDDAVNQLRELLAHVTGMMNYWKRDIDCQYIIAAAESILMTDDVESSCSSLNGESLIPLLCYTDLIQVLARRGKHNEAIESLQRLVGHCEAGYTNLLPSASLFKLCMATVASSSSQLNGIDKATVVAASVKEQEAMLNQLIDLYTRTGNSPECKPTEDLFAIILQEMIKSPCTEEDANRAETLIDQMLSLQVEIENGATFSLAFMVLLSSRTKRVFERSMSIYEKIKTTATALSIAEGNANFLFNLIRVCNHCQPHEREQALPIALKAFGQMSERGWAGADKYAFMLQTIGKLLPNDKKDAIRRQRFALLERIFSMCCRDGCLSSEVRSLFVKQLTRGQVNLLVRRHAGGSSREPDEWTRNVVGPDKPRRKTPVQGDGNNNMVTKLENGKKSHVQ